MSMYRVATIVGLAAAASIGMSGVSASATPPRTPIGYYGACNMDAAVAGLGPAAGVGVQGDGGMVNAMTVNAPQGSAGMYLAVGLTGALEACP